MSASNYWQELSKPDFLGNHLKEQIANKTKNLANLHRMYFMHTLSALNLNPLKAAKEGCPQLEEWKGPSTVTDTVARLFDLSTIEVLVRALMPADQTHSRSCTEIDDFEVVGIDFNQVQQEEDNRSRSLLQSMVHLLFRDASKPWSLSAQMAHLISELLKRAFEKQNALI